MFDSFSVSLLLLPPLLGELLHNAVSLQEKKSEYGRRREASRYSIPRSTRLRKSRPFGTTTTTTTTTARYRVPNSNRDSARIPGFINEKIPLLGAILCPQFGRNSFEQGSFTISTIPLAPHSCACDDDIIRMLHFEATRSFPLYEIELAREFEIGRFFVFVYGEYCY